MKNQITSLCILLCTGAAYASTSPWNASQTPKAALVCTCKEKPDEDKTNNAKIPPKPAPDGAHSAPTPDNGAPSDARSDPGQAPAQGT